MPSSLFLGKRVRVQVYMKEFHTRIYTKVKFHFKKKINVCPKGTH